MDTLCVVNLGRGHCEVLYYEHMPQDPKVASLAQLWRAVVEITFIVFLFYSNLLMGEFTRGHGAVKNLISAIVDVVTLANFAIALVTALIGYVVFEYLRKKL